MCLMWAWRRVNRCIGADRVVRFKGRRKRRPLIIEAGEGQNMGLRKNYATDRTAEVEGVEIAVDMNDHNNEPIYITVSRMGQNNKAYTKTLEERTAPHTAAIQNETLDNELGNKIMQNVFVDTVLKGWRNLPKSELTGDDKDTDDLPYSRENALLLFEALPDFYDVCLSHAKKAANFREAARGKATKN
jgi:hypothetical protein